MTRPAEDVVRDLFTTYAHIERDSDERITAESLYFLAARAIEVDRAEGRDTYTLASLDGTDDAADWLQVGYVLDRTDVEWLRDLEIVR